MDYYVVTKNMRTLYMTTAPMKKAINMPLDRRTGLLACEGLLVSVGVELSSLDVSSDSSLPSLGSFIPFGETTTKSLTSAVPSAKAASCSGVQVTGAWKTKHRFS